MKKLVLSLLLISTVGFSQVEKAVGEFSKVTAFDKIDVYLIKADANKVVLKGKGTENIELVNNNGELKIRMSFGSMFQGDDVSATVYYNDIEAVEANEGSRIASNEVFKTLNFDIIAKEGSEIQLQLEVERLKVKLLQGSVLKLTGTASNTDILINSGGKMHAKELLTEQTVITANTAGEATINASQFVDAKVRAGGYIQIFGEPKQINQKVIAGGTIEQGK